MALLLPAIKGKMGSTAYYQANMPAREVVSGFRPAKELDHWANMGIDERIQRDPNLKRIKEEIVPYLARSKDRLFGALIILVYRGSIEWEPLDDIGGKIPVAYRKVADKIGFITVDGGELIVLDGQHRLLALRQIIQDGAEGEYVSQVPNDDVSIIFVAHESDEKTRRIFNKVNRYAKPTTRADNIITSEDDGCAIITRQLMEDEAPLGRKHNKDIVEWKSNTLSDRSVKFTTISSVYESVRAILAAEGITNFDEKHQVNRPSDKELEHAYERAAEWWNAILEIEPYKQALADTSVIPSLREPAKKFSLLFKPVGQIALIRALINLKGRGITVENALKRAVQIDWAINASHWVSMLVTPDGKIIAREENIQLTSAVVAYMIAPKKFSDDEALHLKKHYNAFRGCEDIDDPNSETKPVELPQI